MTCLSYEERKHRFSCSQQKCIDGNNDDQTKTKSWVVQRKECSLWRRMPSFSLLLGPLKIQYVLRVKGPFFSLLLGPSITSLLNPWDSQEYAFSHCFCYDVLFRSCQEVIFPHFVLLIAIWQVHRSDNDDAPQKRPKKSKILLWYKR